MLTKDAGHLLHDARERKGLSRADLEKLTKENGYEVSAGQIYNLEKDKVPTPRKRTVYALCAVLDLDSSLLFAAPEAEKESA